MPIDSEFQRHLEQSAAFRNRCAEKSLPGDQTARHRLANSFAQLAFNHHRGMTCLLGEGCFTSATALLRPMLEVATKTMLICFVAKDKQLVQIEGGDDRSIRDFSRAVAAVDKEFVGGKWGRMLPRFSTLNDLLHAGTEQIQRHQVPSKGMSDRDAFYLCLLHSDIALGVSYTSALGIGPTLDDATDILVRTLMLLESRLPLEKRKPSTEKLIARMKAFTE